jgi:hypothetical protein
MIGQPASRRRFQFSMRTLLIVVAMLALLLMPAAWVLREQQVAMVAEERLRQAQAVAERERNRAAMALAQQQFNRNSVARGLQEPVLDKGDPGLDRGKADSIEELRRENARLRAQVEALRGELERLRASKGP